MTYAYIMGNRIVDSTETPEENMNLQAKPKDGTGVDKTDIPGIRPVRPGFNVDTKAVQDAVQGAWNGNRETITEIASSFGVELTTDAL